jgi:hypothetical protein
LLVGGRKFELLLSALKPQNIKKSPNLILLLGPPAVGKMTVGQELSQRLDYPLFHNHLSIELAVELFGWGSPEFGKVNEGIRQLVFQTAAESPNLQGFIFTLVAAFDEQDDLDYLDALEHRFQEAGWTVYYVELYAPLDVRLERNDTPNRLTHKASKRNVELSAENVRNMEAKYQMNTPAGLDKPHYFQLDNSNLSPAVAAERILSHFGLAPD